MMPLPLPLMLLMQLLAIVEGPPVTPRRAESAAVARAARGERVVQRTVPRQVVQRHLLQGWRLLVFAGRQRR